jgi:hypothetical protein
MRFIFSLVLACTLFQSAGAADTLRVLYIGNSYTHFQELPKIVSRMAAAGGDSIFYGMNAPGGYTLEQHSADITTLNLIAQGNWDFVVLQEQSQKPSFPEGQVAAEVYPFAKELDSLVHHYNPCAKTVFYMTWGRKNGDAQNCAGWPPVCTYRGMDSLLQLRYTIMAEDNNAWISPVARAWRYLRTNNPAIDLYHPDASHPSAAGSYAAAACFYSLFLGKDPAGNSYNFTLNNTDAQAIKAAVSAVVYDSLAYWQRFAPLPVAAFSASNSNKTVTFTNTSDMADSYFWDFGDNASSVAANPVHTYAQNGNYTVCLSAIKGCDTIVLCKQVQVGTVGLIDPVLQGLRIYPNPVTDRIIIEGLASALSYRLYNSTGGRVASGQVDQQQPGVDISSLANGIYLIHLADKSGRTRILKLIKQ